jgi:hypothetical protein
MTFPKKRLYLAHAARIIRKKRKLAIFAMGEVICPSQTKITLVGGRIYDAR